MHWFLLPLCSILAGALQAAAAPAADRPARVLAENQPIADRGDGTTWRKFDWGSEISGNGTIRVALYATGGGEARFRHFTYRGL
jgi:hypothetical protein